MFESMSAPMLSLSVVMPTWNAAGQLPASLAALGEAPAEILIADGGSADRERVRAILAGHPRARLITAARGRGTQLGAGAARAGQPWLLFLHADTRLAPGWAAAAAAFMAGPGNTDRAAAFTFALDMPGRAARRLERYVAWRSRRLGLPYGDQGLLISRALYDESGGFAPIPLMEDVDLVRRIGRRRIDLLPARAITAAGRYRRHGIPLRGARNLGCLALYFAGLPPRLIARLYG